MTKVVLDSNAMRRGQFSLPALRRWIEAGGGANAEIVIPEVVIWEWAEHAWSAHATLRTQLQEFKVDSSIVEIPVLDHVGTKADLVREIEAALPRTVTVWRPNEPDLRDALKDQVLQVRNGELKQGVKTGAADSTILACLRDQVDDRRNAEAVVLATDDSLLRKVCAARFPTEVLLASGSTDLLAKLLAFEPAQDELNEAVEESIQSFVTDDGTPIGSAIATFEMGFTFGSHASEGSVEAEHPDVPTRELVRLRHVDIVELHDLQVTDPHSADRVGIAKIRIFADLWITALELRRDASAGTNATWAVTFDGNVTGGHVDLQVEVRFDAHWDVVSVSPSGEAIILFDDDPGDGNLDPFLDEAESLETSTDQSSTTLL